MKKMVLCGVLMLAGCAGPIHEAYVAPEVVIDCPEPELRDKIGKGDNVYDLARAHAKEVDGWSRCHSALDITNSK